MVVLLFVIGFLALVAYSTIKGKRYRVEVCMAYQGRTNCRTVSAKSENAALRSGSNNACADLTSGVTDTMRCEQSPPKSIKWLERPERASQ